MRLDNADFRRLDSDARRLNLAGGKAYMSEALKCVRRTGDPVDALELLSALRGSSHAERPAQRKAIDGVGRWLEQRLRREPGVAAERVALELGWLRRMAVILEHERKQGRAAPGSAPRDPRRGPRPERSREPGFGRELERLRQARQRALRLGSSGNQRSTPAQADSPPSPPPQQQPLPAVLEVEFADVQQLRETRKLLRRKKPGKKPGKPPKERWLGLRPADPALQDRMAGLCCSTTRTEGIDAVFAATDANGGVPPRFHVRTADVEDQGERRVARRLFLDAPGDDTER